ncbi:MAG: hypothetical protein JXL81_12540 [Deltaproteobacteria bacterium]|nr:hypothetical protein [Deltaproteobacteria bacterium]
METMNNEQVERTLEDIASIKEVINRNQHIIQSVTIWQQFMNLRNFRLLALLWGISITFFSMLFYLLMDYYGSYGDIPVSLKWIIYTAIAIDAVYLTIIKLRIISGILKKQNLTMRWFYTEFFPKRYDHIGSSSIYLFLFLIVYFIIKCIPYFIIPLLCMVTGLMMILPIGLDIKRSLYIGYWFLVMGICSLIFTSIPVPVVITVTFGFGYFLMAIMGYLDQESEKVE